MKLFFILVLSGLLFTCTTVSTEQGPAVSVSTIDPMSTENAMVSLFYGFLGTDFPVAELTFSEVYEDYQYATLFVFGENDEGLLSASITHTFYSNNGGPWEKNEETSLATYLWEEDKLVSQVINGFVITAHWEGYRLSQVDVIGNDSDSWTRYGYEDERLTTTSTSFSEDFAEISYEEELVYQEDRVVQIREVDEYALEDTLGSTKLSYDDEGRLLRYDYLGGATLYLYEPIPDESGLPGLLAELNPY